MYIRVEMKPKYNIKSRNNKQKKPQDFNEGTKEVKSGEYTRTK